MAHNRPCTFTEPHYGLVVCDQGEHDCMFCITCGRPLPSYLGECYECQEAARSVPNLAEHLEAIRRSLVMQKRKELSHLDQSLAEGGKDDTPRV